MVYLIHFDQPLHHAKHYVGYTSKEKIEDRLARHRRGEGANLLRVLNNLGIGYQIVKVWPKGTRKFERGLKNNGHTGMRYCPLCRDQGNVSLP